MNPLLAEIERLKALLAQRDALLAEIKTTAEAWFSDPESEQNVYMTTVWNRLNPMPPKPETPAPAVTGWEWIPSKSPCRKCGALTVRVHEINDHPDLDIECTTCGDRYQVDGPDA